MEMRPARRHVPAFVSVLVCAGAGGLAGQAADPAGPATAPVTDTLQPAAAPLTLAPWAEEVWMAILDRDGRYDGRLSDQGVFQRFNRRKDYEYALDVRSGIADREGDAIWLHAVRGVRIRGASISPTQILNRVDWKDERPIAGNVALRVRYRRDRSLEASRDYPWVGVAWRPGTGKGWVLHGGVGIHFFKPSADVEVGLARSWRDGRDGRWRAELAVAGLDLFNDVIYNAIGVEESEVDVLQDYRSRPVAVRATVRRAGRTWSGEVHVGGSTSAEVDVRFPGGEERPFLQRERVWFAGAVVGARPAATLRLSLHGAVARARTDRTYADDASGSFELREETRRLGTAATLRLSTAWDVDAMAERVWRPESRHRIRAAPLRHDDREDYVELAVVRRPLRGWALRAALQIYDRDTTFDTWWLRGAHQRLNTEFGYRFASGFRVTAGVRWDLDDFAARPFDGAHLRIMTVW